MCFVDCSGGCPACSHAEEGQAPKEDEHAWECFQHHLAFWANDPKAADDSHRRPRGPQEDPDAYERYMRTGPGPRCICEDDMPHIIISGEAETALKNMSRPTATWHGGTRLESGHYEIEVDDQVLECLDKLRGPDDDYSDVILRMYENYQNKPETHPGWN